MIKVPKVSDVPPKKDEVMAVLPVKHKHGKISSTEDESTDEESDEDAITTAESESDTEME